MSNVKILSPEVVSKIAAGEVIERPSSVVKELIENAIDAGAKRIEILIKDAGRSLIQVKDDGCGIAQDDLENIFHRHATSKISSVDDLFHITSLGFRGEALYSIASVSDIILRSKTHEQDSGFEIHIRGGNILEVKPVGMQTGTEVEIYELFFNTPARRKFLRKNTTEFNHIMSMIIPYTLIHPSCSFMLTSEYKSSQRTVLHLLADNNSINRVARALHVEKDHIIELHHVIPNRDVTMHAFLGDMNIRRTSKDLQFIFVNGRPVINRLLSYRLNEMYRLLFPSEIYPFFILFLDVPQERVDVNIHPTKREVKIEHEYDLYSAIRSFCEETLSDRSKAKQIEGSPFEMPNKMYPPRETSYTKTNIPNQTYPPSETYPQEYIATATQNLLKPFDQSTAINQPDALRKKLSVAQHIGVFKKKYLIFETPDSLLIIDQHAAQERITFETLMAQISNGTIEIQHLLVPILLKVTQQEMHMWEDKTSQLELLGFSTSQWDTETIAIHTHPQLILKPEMAVRNILADTEITQCNIEKLSRIACRKSVMAGDLVDKNGAENIRTCLVKAAEPFTCPHGRPTVIELPEKFLNKQFLRT